MRSLEACLQDHLLGLLAALLCATHPHEVPGLTEGQQLRPEEVVPEGVIQHQVFFVLLRGCLATQEHLGPLRYLPVPGLCSRMALLCRDVQHDALSWEPCEERQGFTEGSRGEVAVRARKLCRGFLDERHPELVPCTAQVGKGPSLRVIDHLALDPAWRDLGCWEEVVYEDSTPLSSVEKLQLIGPVRVVFLGDEEAPHQVWL
mmetsp:Transcript_132896/g.370517  ORF Transcript_132896/g.370517 Transcript_132896/m.370517 type:complete len:203 (-) Transcript_132896:664-1272(-)